jgi:hypothetical protein
MSSLAKAAPTVKLDAKHTGHIYKVKDGSILPDDEWVVFHVTDNAFAAILPAYLETSRQMGVDPEQIFAVERLIGRLNRWRANNPHRLKVPDAKGEKLLDV